MVPLDLVSGGVERRGHRGQSRRLAGVTSGRATVQRKGEDYVTCVGLGWLAALKRRKKKSTPNQVTSLHEAMENEHALKKSTPTMYRECLSSCQI